MSRLYEAFQSGGLKRGPGPKRRTPLKKRNAKRARKRYETQFGSKAKWIRSLPCCACHKEGPSDPHHVKTRGAGGTSEDLVPLCADCHRELLPSMGIDTFGARWNIDLRQKAVVYEGWWQDGQRTGEVDLGF